MTGSRIRVASTKHESVRRFASVTDVLSVIIAKDIILRWYPAARSAMGRPTE
jgi:hypothetical protein